MPNNDEYLTLKEVSQLLKISEITIYRLVEKNKLPAIKIGKQWRFSRTKIEDWSKWNRT